MSAITQKHRRKSYRAGGYDYSTPGSYFVTICVQDHQLAFGDVVDQEMVLIDVGLIADAAWRSLPDRFPDVDIDSYVIMPNHIHGIVVINELPCVAAQFIVPGPHGSQTKDSRPNIAEGKQGAINCAATRKGTSLGNIVRVFKAVTTDGIRRSGLTSFRWQSNYYDHIIRNERDLDRIRYYILANPSKWELDHENPSNFS